MIRVFNHYLHRSALRSVAFDLTMVLLVTIGAIAFFADGVSGLVPQAGTHVVSFAACLFMINSASGLYSVGPSDTASRAVARAVFVLMLALPLAYVIFSLLPTDVTRQGGLQVTVMTGIAALVMRRVYVSQRSQARLGRTRILVFGAGTAAKVAGDALKAVDPNALIVGYVAGPNESTAAVPADELLQLDGTLTDTARRLQVDEIVVALTERRAGSMPLRQLLDCKLEGIKVFDLNTHFEKTLGQIRIDYVNASWLIFGDGFQQGALRTATKRVFDVLSALTLIVLSAPVMAVTALLIKLESPGPVLYRQERVGQSGRLFKVTKFRSMRTDAEKDGRPVWASKNDNRVTRIGNVIRKLRIDELPQLFNVLVGEMSMVGPRPERLFFVEQLTQEIPFYAVRHSVKPGVTGWAQVRYHYGSTVEDSQQKLQYDLYYVKNHSLFLDMVVLLETVGVVLTGKGAR